jgi:predicted acyl esterase
MMAAAAAAQGNIKAIGLMGFYGDVYRDVAMIGGIPCKGFGDSYAAFTKASEQNVAVSDPKIRSELPSIFLLMQEMLFDGVAPASTEEIMRVAIEQHRNNYDMAAKSRQENVTCHDDVVAEVNGKSYTWSDISDPDRTIDGLIRNGVSVSTWAGYYDAGSLRASIRTHNKIVQGGGKSRLVQGPWSHGISLSLSLSLSLFLTHQHTYHRSSKMLHTSIWIGQDGPFISALLRFETVCGLRASWHWMWW